MPLVMRKLPNQDLYRVYNPKTKEIHSYGTTLENAKKQITLLNMIDAGVTLQPLKKVAPKELNDGGVYKKEGEGIETDLFFDNKNKFVSLPEINSVKVELPTYMYKRLPNIKGKSPPYRYRLVNPITATRSIASRKQEKSVDIQRKPIPQPVYQYEDSDELPKLSEFSPEDQEKIQEYYKQVESNEKKDRDKIEEQPAKNLPRGFPVTMYKTAKRLGFKETNEKVYQKKQVAVKPPKEPKLPSEKKPKGRPKKEKKIVVKEDENVIVNPQIITKDGEDPFAQLTEENVSSRASSKKGSKSSTKSLSELSSLSSLAKESESSISTAKSSNKSKAPSVKSESSISTASSGDVAGIDPNAYFANLEKKYGRGIENKISNKSIGMNSWVQYVKDYAAKNGMKYNEALKDPACKAGYKKGGAVCMGKGLVSDVKKAVKSVGKKVGLGIVDEAAAKGYADQVLIADAYNQTQLGSNAHKRYISL
jgi:hypothetical protein